MLRSRWLGLFLWLAFATAHAASAPSDADIEKLMHDSGFDSALVKMPDTLLAALKAGWSKQNGPLSADEMIQWYRPVFTQKHFHDLIADYIKTHADADRVQHAIAAYDTPSGRKIKQWEGTSMQRFDPTALAAYARMFQKNLFARERIKLAIQMESVQHMTDHHVRAQMKLIQVLAQVLRTFLPPDKRFAADALEKRQQSQRDDLIARTYQNSILETLYLYRNLSNEEFEEAIAFYRRPEMTWWNDLAENAMQHALTEAFKEGSQAFFQHLSSPKAKGI